MNDAQKFKNLAQNFSVLFVDDDEGICKSMNLYLQKFFKEVKITSNGHEGLEAYREQMYDFIITDVSMPVMNGIEMVRHIKEINPDQNILIITAFSEFSYIKEAITLGVDGYLLKPVDNLLFIRELSKIAVKLKAIRENEEYKYHLEEKVKEKTRHLEKLQQQKIENYNETLFGLVDLIEKRDTYTAGHSQRVAKYSQLIAQEMHYSDEECELIYRAAILHDLGKISTPDAVLLNPNKLNALEYKLIQEHVIVGYELLEKITMFQDIAKIIVAHHERYDGSGYPHGLKNQEILPLARIMALADTFDAMTTNRIYKKGKSKEESLKEITELREKSFDPDVVDAALKALKNVQIDPNINQLPKTELEKERFAYFFKDSVVDVYNENYFELLLHDNLLYKEYHYIYIIKLYNLGKYNKKYGWQEGNAILKKMAKILVKLFDSHQISRVFGDSFIFLSKERLVEDMKTVEFSKDDLLEHSFEEISLDKIDITSLDDLQKRENDGV